MRARESRFAVALAACLLTACGPSEPATSPEALRVGRKLLDRMMDRSRKDADRSCELIAAHRKRESQQAAGVEKGVYACWSGTKTPMTSPFGGNPVHALQRGVLATRLLEKERVYDGEFLYFFGASNLGTLVFVGRVIVPSKVQSGAPSTATEDDAASQAPPPGDDEEFGLYMADNVIAFGSMVSAHQFVRADRDYMASFEQKYAEEVRAYKAEAERERQVKEAAWSIGEALVVNLGGELLATGNAQLDDLVDTGLKYGVAVARDGGDQATQELLASQRARLEQALQEQAARALARGTKPARP